MKTTIFEDGLDIFVPDEEMVEMFKIIIKSNYSSPLKYQMLNEIMKLIPLKTLKEIQNNPHWRLWMFGREFWNTMMNGRVNE